MLNKHHDGDLKSTKTWEKHDRILEKSARQSLRRRGVAVPLPYDEGW